VLAHPVTRARLVAAKAGAIAVVVLIIALAGWVVMIGGVALGGGGIGLGHLAAFSLHLAFFGLASGAVALAIAAGTGRRALATTTAAGVAIAGWLINGFAPLVSALAWLKYLSPFYYYTGQDPLITGVHIGDLAVLCLGTLALTAVAILTMQHRDLRA
jgi:ABC-2 type transport system permease protein